MEVPAPPPLVPVPQALPQQSAFQRVIGTQSAFSWLESAETAARLTCSACRSGHKNLKIFMVKMCGGAATGVHHGLCLSCARKVPGIPTECPICTKLLGTRKPRHHHEDDDEKEEEEEEKDESPGRHKRKKGRRVAFTCPVCCVESPNGGMWVTAGCSHACCLCCFANAEPPGSCPIQGCNGRIMDLKKIRNFR